MGYESGQYFAAVTATGAVQTATVNTTYFQPVFIPQSTSWDRIAIRTASTFSGTATARLGVYNCGSDGKPSTVVFDAGTVSCTASSTTYAITINQTFGGGWYFVVMNTQTAATTNTFQGTNNYNSAPELLRYVATITASAENGFTESSITGAFATAGTLARTANIIFVGLRKT